MTIGKEATNGRDPRTLRTRTPGECFDLLGPGRIGRVAVSSASEIMILPVNFAMTGNTIIFRTAPDTLLALHADAKVSFEADRLDEARDEGWGVSVHGPAHKASDAPDVRHLEDRTHLKPWAAGARDVYVRIAPTQISGRRVLPREEAGRSSRLRGRGQCADAE